MNIARTMLEELERLRRAPSRSIENHRAGGRLSANTNTLSALIADGDASLRQELAGHLEQVVGSVHQAADGASAVRLFAEHLPDLLLVGLFLPDMEGRQFVDRARELDPEAPVIMLHDGTSPDAALTALEMNGAVYLRTPPDPDKLRAHLKRITRQQLLQRQLRETRSNLEHLLNLYPTFAVLVEDGRIAYLNRKFLDYFGFKTFEQFQAFPGALDARLAEINGQPYQGENDSWAALLTDDPLDREHLVRFVDPLRPDRSPQAFLAAFSPFPSPGRILFTFAEAGEEDEERAALELRMLFDPQTGALNRRSFLDRLMRMRRQTLQGGEPFSLISFAIDRSEAANPGQRCEGPECDADGNALKELTNLVLVNIRGGDCLGRWSGEEFMLLEPRAGLDSARRLAERLRSGVTAHAFGKTPQALTCSFGVVQHRPGEEADQLILRVGAALQQARNNGGNRVVAE